MSGFTRTLKTDHHNDCRGLGIDIDLGCLAAHELYKLLVYDLNDLLSGKKALEHLRADSSLGDGLYKLLNDLEVYIRLKQRELYLAHALLDICLGELALVAELLEGVSELFG